jgi:hypothetical protein
MPVMVVTPFRDFFHTHKYVTPVIMSIDRNTGNAWVKCLADDNMIMMAKLKFQGIIEVVDTGPTIEFTDCSTNTPVI